MPVRLLGPGTRKDIYTRGYARGIQLANYDIFMGCVLIAWVGSSIAPHSLKSVS